MIMYSTMHTQYTIKRKIGEGVSSQVYLGQIKNGYNGPSLVAIKKIRPIHTERAFQEIDAMKRMNHPNVIKLYDYSYIDGVITLVLEYCNRGDLTSPSDDMLQDKFFVADIMRQLISGWQYLKTIDALFIHRDIKLQNILLDEHDGVYCVKIADFGFCMSGSNYSTKRKQLLELTICGSPLYMAPEMFNNISMVMDQYDDRIDIWSMGIVFYKLLFGRDKHPIGNVTDVKQLIHMSRTADSEWSKCIKEAFKTHICTCNNCIECHMVSMTKSMLQINRNKRMMWTDVFGHTFMNNVNDVSNVNTKGPVVADYVNQYLYHKGDYTSDYPYTRVYVTTPSPWKMIGL